MTSPRPRDDILARKRAGLALDYLSTRAQNSRPKLVGDLTQRFGQRSLAMTPAAPELAAGLYV